MASSKSGGTESVRTLADAAGGAAPDSAISYSRLRLAESMRLTAPSRQRTSIETNESAPVAKASSASLPER